MKPLAIYCTRRIIMHKSLFRAFLLSVVAGVTAFIVYATAIVKLGSK